MDYLIDFAGTRVGTKINYSKFDLYLYDSNKAANAGVTVTINNINSYKVAYANLLNLDTNIQKLPT